MRAGGNSRTCYFNPRSPHGERPFPSLLIFPSAGFQSTLPARGATITTAGRATPVIFQSTLPARGATNPPDEGPVARAISIHAPRTGSDGRRERPKTATKRFQSTLPARGATTDGDAQAPPRKISIHAPRTGSDRAASQSQQPPAISIHAPRTGSDSSASRYNGKVDIFQSTLPARGATPARESKLLDGCISIHAPRTGSDTDTSFSTNEQQMISIHAPRTGSDFLLGGEDLRAVNISIHAPRTGSDVVMMGAAEFRPDFNPRSPHGERRAKRRELATLAHFNPRSPHGERRLDILTRRHIIKFQSTLPARGATNDDWSSGKHL